LKGLKEQLAEASKMKFKVQKKRKIPGYGMEYKCQNVIVPRGADPGECRGWGIVVGTVAGADTGRNFS